jgi:DnaK suppressor protein
LSKNPASKTPPKAPAKKAAPASKPASKTAPAKAPKAAKPAAKPAAKTAAKPTTKPAAKPAAKAAAKPVPAKPPAAKPTPVKAATPAPAPAKPTAQTAKAAEPAPKPAATALAPMAAPPPSRAATSRAAARAAAAPPPLPLPAATSRFADRFAPPRPPTRQMAQPLLDAPRPIHKPDPKLANAWKTKAGRELTEAEVLAMPESEYMNDKQLEFFRSRLQQLKDDLLSNAGETTEHLREDTSIVPDPADRATIEEEHALELRTRDRERKLLKKISQSLGRIEAGEYGFCDETGEPIGLGRLIARPTATLSLEAQQRRELKQKMFGD